MDHLETIIRIMSGLVRLFADAPKAWENICKGWEVARPWLLDRKRAVVTTLREMVGEDEVREGAPSPIVQNTAIVPPTGTLCINVFDVVSLSGTATGSASCSATLS
jgi:hypothetical protein